MGAESQPDKNVNHDYPAIVNNRYRDHLYSHREFIFTFSSFLSGRDPAPSHTLSDYLF
jgi:hypothetical protein